MYNFVPSGYLFCWTNWHVKSVEHPDWITHRADHAAAGAPGQARWRGLHKAPDSPERGTLRAERPDSAGRFPPGRPGRPAERCKGGSE